MKRRNDIKVVPSKTTLRDVYEFLGPLLETYGDLPATLILHFGRGENIRVNPSDTAAMAEIMRLCPLDV